MLNELSIKSLLKNFPEASTSDWIKVADNEVRDVAIAKLSWRVTDDLSILPYYGKQEHAKLPIKNFFDLGVATKNFNGARSWINQPPVLVAGEESANQRALLNLQQGADGIFFECNKQSDFKTLLDSVQLEHCHTSFTFTDVSNALQLRDFLHKQEFNEEKIHGGLIWEKIPDNLDELLKGYQGLKKFYSLGLRIQNGPDPVEEIVQTLCLGVKVVDSLTAKGIMPNEIFPSVFFSVESGNDFFFTIAKLKVIRMLWYQIVNAYEATHEFDDIYLHVRCEPFQNEKYAPHANMHKSAIAGLASVCGGCQALTIYHQNANEMTERVARNVSFLLREEAHVNVVADPFAGSYFIDTLVNQMAEIAWSKFQNKMKK